MSSKTQLLLGSREFANPTIQYDIVGVHDIPTAPQQQQQQQQPRKMVR